LVRKPGVDHIGIYVNIGGRSMSPKHEFMVRNSEVKAIISEDQLVKTDVT